MDLTNLQNFIKSKWFPVAAIGLVFFLIILIALSSASKKTQPFPGAEPTLPPQQSIQSDTLITSSPSQSAEVQKAIEEQLKVDQDYASWQKEISDIYPWRKKLPLTSEKYYVYFDLEKKIFIGRIYPNSGDDVEQIKSEVLQRLKEEKGIPTDNYTFSWNIFPAK